MVLKELILTVSTLVGCGGPERTESTDFMLPGNECLNDTWTYINEFHNTKNRLLTVSTLGVCSGSEITAC